MTYPTRKSVLGGLALLGLGGFATPGLAQIEEGVCGCMDVVFAIDDTGSMISAIANVTTDLATIIADIETASAGDAQTAVVSFKDTVEVDSQLTNDGGAAASAAIAALVATGGAGGPEASDEALNTVINALAARIGSDGFTDDWRADCVKITILITDNLPGGFDDTYTLGVDDVNAAQRALDGLNESVRISAIQIDALTPPHPDIATIMMNYADVSGGFYAGLPADGSGTASAISEIIAECGEETIQADIDIKFCSDPNAFNSKQNGKTPVTIFGSDDLDVLDIVIDSLRLCLASDTSVCTDSGPQSWSFADRGDPTTDLGAASCAIVDDVEQDYLNPDGHLDIDVAFDSQEVADLIGADGLPRNASSEPLVIVGETIDGFPIESAPIGDDGIDQLVKKN